MTVPRDPAARMGEASRPPWVRFADDLRKLAVTRKPDGSGYEPDRAALAALRRGLGREPGTVTETSVVVEPRLDPRIRDDHQVRIYYLVATLFAHYQSGRDGPERPADGDLGWSLRQVARRRAGRGDAAPIPLTADDDRPPLDPLQPAVERRFTALLDSHRDDLSTHLRRLVPLLASEDVPVDWARLIHDLLAWDHDDRRVQRHWASSFWRYRSDDLPLRGEAAIAPVAEATGATVDA